MIKKTYNYYFNESSWPFLVSTASLFLTLGAVLFFQYMSTDHSFMVVSFMSLASKSKEKVLYLGGSILGNQLYNKYYSLKSVGIGKANWDPDNYSSETQLMINEFTKMLKTSNKNSAYDIMYAVLGNKDGIFTKNYGKVTSLLNNMIFAYNRNNLNPITEKEFLDYYNFKYENFDLSFINKTNRGTIMSNISEILAPQIVMKDKDNILLERSFCLDSKVNLSFQKNPEYSIGLFIKSDFSQSLIIYDSDLKITEENSLNEKYFDLYQKNISLVSIEKNIFGMNIVIVACHNDQNSPIIFDEFKIKVLISEIKRIALQYPDLFKAFDENSDHFLEFKKTGNISILNKSDFPVVRYYRPNEFYNIPHDNKKFETSSAYLTAIKGNFKRADIKNNTPIPIIEDFYDNN